MNHIIYPILIGIISGIASSAPLGPSNFWVANQAIQNNIRNIWAFSWGCILGDLLYAFIAFWGYHHILETSGWSNLLAWSGSLLLIGLGIYTFRKPQETNSSISLVQSASLLKSCGVGFILCISNPTFIAFWLLVAGFLHQLGLATTWEICFWYFWGIILGDLFWYRFFAWIVGKGVAKLQDIWMDRIRYGVAVSLVLFGLVGIYQLL